MDRINSEGIPRKDLVQTLRDQRAVTTARRIDSCLLCRRGPVNDAGLCDLCYGMLNGEALNLAERWTSGKGP